MEIIRKKICLDDFRSHICGALPYCGSTVESCGNFGGFVRDAEGIDIAGWTGTSLTMSGDSVIRTTEMMRRYNELLKILRNSIHVAHVKNLSCKGDAYENKFFTNFDFNGTTDEFLFSANTGVLYASGFTYKQNYYTYNGDLSDVEYDYLILISDEDAILYNRYFGIDFVNEVHTIAYEGDDRFNREPFIPINILLTHSYDDLGIMELYEDDKFPLDYSEENNLDWFEKQLFERYLEGPEPGYLDYEEDEQARLESRLTTLRDKLYIQDDNGRTLPAIFENFPDAEEDKGGQFFKAIYYTGPSASDGIYETVDGQVVTDTEEQKPYPKDASAVYVIYNGEPTVTTEDWVDEDGHSHHKETTHCDEYRWWEVIPTGSTGLICADDEEVPACEEKYRTQTVFETLANVIIDTPASDGDYYYFLVKYDNRPSQPARIPYTEGEVFNKDIYIDNNDNYIYSGDKILEIDSESEEGYISFKYVLGAIFTDDTYTDYTGGTIYNEKYPYLSGLTDEISLDGYSGVTYWYNSIDFDSAKEQIINRDFNLSRMVNMSEISNMTTGDVWKKDGSVYNSPIIKEDYLMGFAINGKIDIDVEIDRGNAAAFESHFRLTECNSFDDIISNGNNGFFNIE